MKEKKIPTWPNFPWNKASDNLPKIHIPKKNIPHPKIEPTSVHEARTTEHDANISNQQESPSEKLAQQDNNIGSEIETPIEIDVQQDIMTIEEQSPPLPTGRGVRIFL
ncbi:MAG: hypothetical protein JM58_17715 [Peptococcaceae bacterium BICA1-8]|nr:MAG: hypothetical protein JM58_17715 [Peptococcaceae bacterium BICA1-8]